MKFKASLPIGEFRTATAEQLGSAGFESISGENQPLAVDQTSSTEKAHEQRLLNSKSNVAAGG